MTKKHLSIVLLLLIVISKSSFTTNVTFNACVRGAGTTEINGRYYQDIGFWTLLPVVAGKTMKLDNTTTGTYFLKIFDEKLQVLKVQKVVRE